MRRSLRTLFFLTIAFLLAIGFSVSAEAGPSQQASTPEPTTTPAPSELSGVVTLNGGLAPAGVGIAAVPSDESPCGSTTTQDGGEYTLVTGDCPAGDVLAFQLEATGDRVDTEATVDTRFFNIAFEGLSSETLVAVGVTSEVKLPEPKDRPLLEDDDLFWLLVIVVIGELLVLGWMVVWITLNQGKNEAYRRQIEAMVLLGVVVAIIVLGVTGKIGDEGLVSVLAAIVGYTLGRAAGASTEGSSG